MKKIRTLILILVSPILLISCIKADTLTRELETPTEMLELPDSISATIKIAIIGDSISSFKGSSPSDARGYDGSKYDYYYPKGDVDGLENMWWYKVAVALSIPIDNICNCSWSGSRVTGNSSSTTNAFAACSTKRIVDLSSKGFNPDLVLCFISCNDWANNVPLGNWSVTDSVPKDGVVSTAKEAYALMISKIKDHYPSCQIFCLTNLEDTKRDYTPGWPSNNSKGVSVDYWNKSLSEVSTEFGCNTINLKDCGINYDNISSYSIDGGLHPNDVGMTMIANKVAKELSKYLIIGQNH